MILIEIEAVAMAEVPLWLRGGCIEDAPDLAPVHLHGASLPYNGELSNSTAHLCQSARCTSSSPTSNALIFILGFEDSLFCNKHSTQ